MPRSAEPLKIPEGEPLSPEIAFAITVRERRAALGLRLADLEGDEEFDSSYVSRIEKAQRQVCLRGILHLATKLQMEPHELMAEVVKRLRES